MLAIFSGSIGNSVYFRTETTFMLKKPKQNGLFIIYLLLFIWDSLPMIHLHISGFSSCLYKCLYKYLFLSELKKEKTDCAEAADTTGKLPELNCWQTLLQLRDRKNNQSNLGLKLFPRHNNASEN